MTSLLMIGKCLSHLLHWWLWPPICLLCMCCLCFCRANLVYIFFFDGLSGHSSQVKLHGACVVSQCTFKMGLDVNIFPQSKHWCPLAFLMPSVWLTNMCWSRSFWAHVLKTHRWQLNVSNSLFLLKQFSNVAMGSISCFDDMCSWKSRKRMYSCPQPPSVQESFLGNIFMWTRAMWWPMAFQLLPVRR